MAGTCPKCGAPRSGGTECPVCGVIYAKAEQQRYEKRKEHSREQHRKTGQPETTQPPPMTTNSDRYSIDCQACKLPAGMEKRKIWRFPLFIRFIGAIIAAPSAFGMLVGLFAIFSRKGFGMDGGLLLPGVFVLATSAVFGLIGWLLLMRKRAWVCARCGYMMDRA